jgi:uncharacterized protein (DUF1501 family)
MKHTRRNFIGQCCAAVSATGMLSTLSQLRLVGATADSSSDYKALVCLFLAGGNDANNLIIPFDTTEYNKYSTSRGALTLTKSSIQEIKPKTSDGRGWALHPSLSSNVSGTNNSGLKGLFDSGKMAILGNVGTLVVPTTKAQYTSRSVPLPPQLFSHNDQQIEWQSSIPDKPFSTGWGGRIADMVQAMNSSNNVSMCISLAGQNFFQVGKYVSQFAVNPGGSVGLSGYSTTSTATAGMRTKAQMDILSYPNKNMFETAFAGITDNAISDSVLISTIVNANPFTTTFSTSNLGQQLRTIAKLIYAAPQLGLKRQIFFARIGGWDLHDAQLGAHSTLLADVSRNIHAFYTATEEMGVANKVTTFTASDFGRTYDTNGDGSDHGWGSHHIIVGGAVNGGDIYGKMPDLTIRGPDDAGTRGMWIPTTSVDEYSATLASWFGVSDTNLTTILPNIGRFKTRNLGFV